MLVGISVLASVSFALPLCLQFPVPTSVAALAASGGCTLGATTFSGFSITGGILSGGANSDAIDPNSVAVAFLTPFSFVDVLEGNLDAAAWSLSGDQQFSFQLNYTITGDGAWFWAAGHVIIASTTDPAAGV